MKRVQSSCDRISSLPVDLIERILTFLPLKEAGKTSVLSRKWRDVWTRVPELVFDQGFAEVEPEITNPKDRDLVTYFHMCRIFEVLLAHEGTISKFSLKIPGLRGTQQIDRLLLYLSKKSVEDLTLRCTDYEPHSCLFAHFSELVRLDLCCDLFKVPASFGGFSRLTYLKLVTGELAADSLENFLPKCPLLECLSLVYSSNDCEHIAIFGPCLKRFSLCGKFMSICFKNAPLLSVLSIDAPRQELGQGTASSVIQALGSLPLLQVLELGHEVLQIFAAGSIAERLPTTSLDCLKHLQISSPCLNVTKVVMGFICLIRRLPKLRKISIIMLCTHSHRKRICPTILEVQGGPRDASDAPVKFLEEVIISGIDGSRAELDLMQFLLDEAPNLRRLYLVPGKGKNAAYLSRKTANLNCPSRHTKIWIIRD